MESPPLDVKLIRSKIGTYPIGRNFQYFESIASTNTKAYDLVRSGTPLPCLVTAEEQTGGKGRLRRTWFSPFRKGLWITSALSSRSNTDKTGHYNFFISLSAALAIENMTDLNVEFKWPNDILISGKKVCGILSECISGDASNPVMITGIGLNVHINIEEFGEEYRAKATSLLIETGKQIERSRLFIEFVDCMNTVYATWSRNGIESIYREWVKRCTTPGQEVTINSGNVSLSGTAITVNSDGSLVVQSAQGKTRTVYAGDLEYKVAD
ncbi:biotin--[acetyl-CoA-carboxylase] ligase [candidate division KSB1 bacterium]